eukprot:m.174369 g.174369  ORF g.174369 m.174369 type:complete len:1866 (+) comp39111_c1_seq6:173-5770(+)
MKKRINYEKQRRRLLREPDDDKIVVRAPFRNLDYIQAQLTQRKKSGRSQQIEVRFEKEWDFEDFAEICQPDEEERGWDENDTLGVAFEFYGLTKDCQSQLFDVAKVYLLSPLLFCQVTYQEKWINLGIEMGILPETGGVLHGVEVKSRDLDTIDDLEKAFELVHVKLEKHDDAFLEQMLLLMGKIGRRNKMRGILQFAQRNEPISKWSQELKSRRKGKAQRSSQYYLFTVVLALKQVNFVIKQLVKQKKDHYFDYKTGCEDCAEESSFWRNLGDKKFEYGEYQEAIFLYTAALNADPYNATVYGSRAQCYFKLDQYRCSLADGRRCIILYPDWDKGQFQYVQSLVALGCYREAKEASEAALRMCNSSAILEDQNKAVTKEAANPENAKEMDDDLPPLETEPEVSESQPKETVDTSKLVDNPPLEEDEVSKDLLDGFSERQRSSSSVEDVFPLLKWIEPEEEEKSQRVEPSHEIACQTVENEGESLTKEDEKEEERTVSSLPTVGKCDGDARPVNSAVSSVGSSAQASSVFRQSSMSSSFLLSKRNKKVEKVTIGIQTDPLPEETLIQTVVEPEKETTEFPDDLPDLVSCSSDDESEDDRESGFEEKTGKRRKEAGESDSDNDHSRRDFLESDSEGMEGMPLLVTDESEASDTEMKVLEIMKKHPLKFTAPPTNYEQCTPSADSQDKPEETEETEQVKKVVKKRKKVDRKQMRASSFKDGENTPSLNSLISKGNKEEEAGDYKTAIATFRRALDVFTTNPGRTADAFYVTAHCYLANALTNSGSPADLHEAVSLMEKAKKLPGGLYHPLVYQRLSMAFCHQYRFTEALAEARVGLKVLDELDKNRIVQGLSRAPMPEKDQGYLRSQFHFMISACSHPPKWNAYDRFHDYSGRREIYFAEPDFKGFVRVICTEGCRVEYLPSNWRKVKVAHIDRSTEKDFLSCRCLTPDCCGTIICVEIYDHDSKSNSPKKQYSAESVKATKPAVMRGKQQRKMEKKAAAALSIRLRKEKEAAAEKEKSEGKAAAIKVESVTISEDSSVQSLPSTPTEAGAKKEKVSIVREGGFVLKKEEVEENGQRKTQAVHKLKKKKAKNVQHLEEFLGPQEQRIQTEESAENNEGGVLTGFDTDSPFAIPPHLQEQVQAMEADLDIPDLPSQSLQSLASSQSVEPPKKAETELHDTAEIRESVSSYFLEIIRRYGPMEVSDERIQESFTLISEGIRTYVEKVGGLFQFLSECPDIRVDGKRLHLARDDDVTATTSASEPSPPSADIWKRPSVSPSEDNDKPSAATKSKFMGFFNSSSGAGVSSDEKDTPPPPSAPTSAVVKKMKNAKVQTEIKSKTKESQTSRDLYFGKVDRLEKDLAKGEKKIKTLTGQLDESKEKVAQMQKKFQSEQESSSERLVARVEAAKKPLSRRIQDLEARWQTELKRFGQEKRDRSDQVKTLRAKLKEFEDEEAKHVNGRKELESMLKDLRREIVEQKESFDVEVARYQQRGKDLQATARHATRRAEKAEVQVLELQRDKVTTHLEMGKRDAEMAIMHLSTVIKNTPNCPPAAQGMLSQWQTYVANLVPVIEQHRIAFDDRIQSVQNGREMNALSPVNIAIPIRPNFPSPRAPVQQPQPQLQPPPQPQLHPQQQPQQLQQQQPHSKLNPQLAAIFGESAKLEQEQVHVHVQASAPAASQVGLPVRPVAQPVLQQQQQQLGFEKSPQVKPANLNSFEKLIAKLSAIFPTFSRADLSECLKIVRAENRNSLAGLQMEEIVSRVTDVVLSRFQTKLPPGRYPFLLQQQQQRKQLQIPRMTATASARGHQKEDEEEMCVICHETMLLRDRVVLECGHKFHAECIRKWLTEQSTCPTCRVHSLLPDEYPNLK